MYPTAYEPAQDKTYTLICGTSSDSAQTGHLPSLIKVYTICMKKARVLSFTLSAQRRLIRLDGCPVWSASLLSAGSKLVSLASYWVHIKDSDQTGRMPSLICVFTARVKEAWVLSFPLTAQRRLWSDWADAQADLSLHWAHIYFVGYVMRWLMKK